MDYKTVLVEKKNNIATVTLNRPEKLNALSEELQEDVYHAMIEVSHSDDVKVIILKGAGRAFSVGFDVDPKSPGRSKPITITQDQERLRKMDERFLTIREVPRPVIAQIHGYALAGGTMLASMCDLVYVAEDTRVGSIQAPLGAGFVTSTWVWLVGPRKAKEIFYPIGTTIDGKEAEKIGWANKAVPADKLEAEVNEMARKIAETPLEILKVYKIQINRIQDMMGYRTAIMSGCDADAIAHFGEAVPAFYAIAREKGLKRALNEWRGNIP
ncbi:MAG: enoyl-CoA hydratase-related protein [Dehalococcoidales bacterium]|nr:enoyl-CoA hydratase-related protein [Dehalococcoidales bacterium]